MRFSITAILAITLTASACGGDSSSSPTVPTRTNGTFNLMLEDSPFSEAKSLLVTFTEVTAHRTGGEFTRFPFAAGATSRTCDLKKLTDAQDVLGTGPLPTGHYTQVRLVVSSATIYFDSAASGPACATATAPPAGRSASVDIPSGEVRLNREFDITSTTMTTMLLDFDGDRSVRQIGNGRYMMAPVIAVVSVL